MGNPRTPQYFPKMKVRGARRRRLAPWQRVCRALDGFKVSAANAAISMRVLGEMMKDQRSKEVEGG